MLFSSVKYVITYRQKSLIKHLESNKVQKLLKPLIIKSDEQFLLLSSIVTASKRIFDIISAERCFLYNAMVRTAGLCEGRAAGGGIRTLCLCMKSCGGIASVVAGGTKV